MDSYVLWRRGGFPGPGSSKGLKLTYADLAEVDEYVTTVIRFVERGIHQPAPVDVLGMLDALMERIERLAAESSEEDLKVARAQHAYAALAALLYRQFLEAAPQD
jgi:hypothetical protein